MGAVTALFSRVQRHDSEDKMPSITEFLQLGLLLLPGILRTAAKALRSRCAKRETAALLCPAPIPSFARHLGHFFKILQESFACD